MFFFSVRHVPLVVSRCGLFSRDGCVCVWIRELGKFKGKTKWFKYSSNIRMLQFARASNVEHRPNTVFTLICDSTFSCHCSVQRLFEPSDFRIHICTKNLLSGNLLFNLDFGCAGVRSSESPKYKTEIHSLTFRLLFHAPFGSPFRETNKQKTSC